MTYSHSNLYFVRRPVQAHPAGDGAGRPQATVTIFRERRQDGTHDPAQAGRRLGGRPRSRRTPRHPPPQPATAARGAAGAGRLGTVPRDADAGRLLHAQRPHAPPSHEACHATVLQARRGIRNGYRPPLVLPLESLDKYDTLFVGTPHWWSTVAPPVASFLTRFSLAGKTVIPFVTHGGGGLADCERDLQVLCPGASFRPALALKDADVPNAAQTVRDWARNSLAPTP